MLFESITDDVKRLYGKPYAGNKLCLYTQIRMTDKATCLKYAINRLIKHAYPISRLSLQDYHDLGAKFVVVDRKWIDNIESLMRRQKMTHNEASLLYDRCMMIVDELNKHFDCCEIAYESFIGNPVLMLNYICDFLNIPYDPKMLMAQDYNEKYPSAASLYQNQNHNAPSA